LGKIEPSFWTGTAAIEPARFTLDCRGALLPGQVDGGVKKAKELYEREGLVLLTNTGLGSDLDAMGMYGREILGENMKYEGGANSRMPIARNVYDTGAPKEAYLHYHHEMAYVSESTEALCFCCAASCDDPDKGWTFLSHNAPVTEDIMKTELGRKLKERGICYIRCLTDEEAINAGEMSASGVYNTWQRSFGVDTVEEVEKLARAKGLVLEWGPGRYLRTKFYTSAFEYCPVLKKNMLYSSIADNGSWFDTWPGVMELPDMESFETATPEQKPLLITYGDDTPFTEEELRLYADVYDRHGIPLRWKQGDIAVVCNRRFAHGRPAYFLNEGEERTLGVVLGRMFKREGERQECW